MPSTSTRNRRSWPYALVALALLVYLVLPDRPAPSFQDLAQKMPQIPQNLPEWVEHFPQVPWRPRPPKKNPFAAPDATQQKIPKKSLKLREEIEKQTDHLTQHSPTLTFSHIYVVSLPSRQDRRQTMSRLASALGLKFTFIDAEPKDSDMITWIGERVFETRRKKRRPLAKAMGLPVEEIGGVAVGSPWLAMDGQKGEAGTLALPSLKDARWQDLTWTEFLEQEETKGLASGTSSPLLRPLNASFDVVEALWDPTEARDTRQTNSAVLSTWHSHVKAIKTMRANDDESALVLEDDVDMEWDIESVWAAVHRRLPPEWELVYLGSCWGRESTCPFSFTVYCVACAKLYAQTRPSYIHLYSTPNRLGVCMATPCPAQGTQSYLTY